MNPESALPNNSENPTPSTQSEPKSPSDANAHLKEQLRSIPTPPSLTDAEFRIACDEIAEALSKKWWFKFQITGVMFVVVFGLISLGGISLLPWVSSKIDDFRTETDKKIGTARDAIAEQVKAEFAAPKIQTVLTEVAAEQSAKMLKNSVQPQIVSFNDLVQKRLTDFDQFLKAQKEGASKDIEEMRTEVAKLKRRNETTALADEAITNGDVEAYRQLQKLARDEKGDVAVLAELFRVFQAYSDFGPTRWPSVKLNPSVVNPKKTKEEELEPDDLFPLLLLAPEPQARARAARLLANKAKAGSYRTALLVATAIKQEKHLEVLKRLREVFGNVAGYRQGGSLDGSDVLDWWKEHQEEVKKNDTDALAKP